MAVKLHRCRLEWLKTGPCWRVEKALKEMGVDCELAPGLGGLRLVQAANAWRDRRASGV